MAEQEREVGVRAAPVRYTPPKYGPPPGYPAEKWRGLSRARRREILREAVRTINRMGH